MCLGNLYVGGILDRETVARYELTASVIDGGQPANSADVVVIVDVLDVNDNGPVFSQETYRLSIEENQPPGSAILPPPGISQASNRIQALDADSGQNAVIRYKIQQGMSCSNDSVKSRLTCDNTAVAVNKT